MKEGDIISINGVTYVAIKTHVGDGFLYFDSKALHYYCGQHTNFENDNIYIKLILVLNYPKWENGDFCFVKDSEERCKYCVECANSWNDKIIETQYGKMYKISSDYFGTILMDDETYKYYQFSSSNNVFTGGNVILTFYFDDDLESRAITYLFSPNDYCGFADIERDFIEQEKYKED